MKYRSHFWFSEMEEIAGELKYKPKEKYLFLALQGIFTLIIRHLNYKLKYASQLPKVLNHEILLKGHRIQTLLQLS